MKFQINTQGFYEGRSNKVDSCGNQETDWMRHGDSLCVQRVGEEGRKGIKNQGTALGN